jgi:malate dehydrogenase
MSALRRKIAVVGAAPTAGLVAWSLAVRHTLQVHLAPGGSDPPPGVLPAAGWDDLAGADILVLAADDPAGADLDALARDLAARAPDAVVVVAGRGDAAACAGLLARTAFPRGRVLGVGGVAASNALRRRLAAELSMDPAGVTGLVLGGAGAAAVPVRATFTLAGAPVAQAALETALACGPGEPGPHALAAAAREIVEAVALDARRLLPCTARCQGEYGIEGAVAAVPVLVGAEGIEAILEIPLTDEERAALRRAAV